MRTILFIAAIILIISWLVGVFVYALSGLFNIIIVVAIIFFIIGLITKAKNSN